MAKIRVFNFTAGMSFDDATTTYDMADGDTTFETEINVSKSLGLQLVWGVFTDSNGDTQGTALDAVDAVVQIQNSNSETYDDYYGTSSKTLSTVSGSYSFAFSNMFEFRKMQVTVTVNAVTAGTLMMLISKK